MLTENTFGFTEAELGREVLQVEEKEAEKTAEVNLSYQEVIEASKESLDFLASLLTPDTYEYPYPDVYLGIWSWLREFIHKKRDFSQLALGLPRGFAKTSTIKLFVAYTILFTEKKFILVVCENTKKAVNVISDVMKMLKEPNVRAVFGDYQLGQTTDRLDHQEFTFRGRTITILGMGVESGIRGITINNERPDLMIFDDIQSRAAAESEVQTSTLEREFIGTAMKSKSPKGCLFIFIANMYPTKHSLLRKLKANPNWIKFIVGGILSNGKSLWEELQPIKQLLAEFKNDLSMGHPEIFYSEVLNDETASVNTLIDLNLVPDHPINEYELHTGSFVIIDPSGNKKKSDATAVGYYEVFRGEPKPSLEELRVGKMTPLESIEAALKFCLEKNCRLVVIESVAYQYSHLFWFDYITKQRGITGIHCVDIYPKGTSKTTRIIEMFKLYLRGEILVNPRVRAQVHHQIVSFNPLREDNVDDILDLQTYAPIVLANYSEYIANSTIIMNEDFEAVEVFSAEANSPF